MLRGRAASDHAIAEALVSTMLLEDSSPRRALADFLLARKASIQQLLNQPQHGKLQLLSQLHEGPVGRGLARDL